MRALSLKDSHSVRWDPLMICWCLKVCHLSSSAYEVLRETGVVKLPSQRTLHDYTYVAKAVADFSHEVDSQLSHGSKYLLLSRKREACNYPHGWNAYQGGYCVWPQHRYVCKLPTYTYMYVHPFHLIVYIVTARNEVNYVYTIYCTCAGAVVGFTNLGDINGHLKAFERLVGGEDVGLMFTCGHILHTESIPSAIYSSHMSW